jgi:N-acetylglutamate synthase-like GNAT family acetyltransferase
MGPVDIRRARHEDAGEIVKIITEAMKKYASDSGIKGTLPALRETVSDVEDRIKTDIVLIALSKKNITGTLTIHKISDSRAEIRRFAVTPSVQRTGIGKKLFDEAKKIMTGSGYVEVVLHTAIENRYLFDFYISRDFKLISEDLSGGYRRGFMLKNLTD